MGRTFTLGRLFGTDIEAGLDFFLMLAYVVFIFAGGNTGVGAIFALIFVVSILVHEFGHVYAVRKRLELPSKVILMMFGGLCVYPRLAEVRARDQIFISLAGPAFGFALAGIAWLVWRNAAVDPLVARVFWLTFQFNLFINAANLLPIYPLDGGQALRAGLSVPMGEAKAARVVSGISVVTGCVVAMVAFHFGYRIGAILAILLVVQNLWGPRG